MSQPFVIVAAAGQRRLVRLADIREVLPLMALSEAGAGQGLCRGMANVRGEMIPVFDVSGQGAPMLPSRFILISWASGQPIGLIVDEVDEVVTLGGEQLAERVLGGGVRAVVGRLGDDIVSLLEPAEVIGGAR